jgi:hypothetical protein
MSIEDLFPDLSAWGYRITSACDVTYNCIAWAAGRTDAWWWPDPMGVGYWPTGLPRTETMSAVVRAFEELGFLTCQSAGLEPGFEKIVIYASAGSPTHIARQLPTGLWTSKLGVLEDIEHTVEGLAGSEYGSPDIVMKRPN